MPFKKKFLSLLFALTLSVSVVGCGGDDNGGGTISAADQQQIVSLVQALFGFQGLAGTTSALVMGQNLQALIDTNPCPDGGSTTLNTDTPGTTIITWMDCVIDAETIDGTMTIVFLDPTSTVTLDLTLTDADGTATMVGTFTGNIDTGAFTWDFTVSSDGSTFTLDASLTFGGATVTTVNGTLDVTVDGASASCTFVDLETDASLNPDLEDDIAASCGF